MRTRKYVEGTWQYKISIIGRDFCLCTDKVDSAISQVEKQYSGKPSGYCYDRAYAMIKPLIMAI